MLEKLKKYEGWEIKDISMLHDSKDEGINIYLYDSKTGTEVKLYIGIEYQNDYTSESGCLDIDKDELYQFHTGRKGASKFKGCEFILADTYEEAVNLPYELHQEDTRIAFIKIYNQVGDCLTITLYNLHNGYYGMPVSYSITERTVITTI